MRPLALLVALGLGLPVGPEEVEEDAQALAMTPPIACRVVHGYRDYEALTEPSLTKDEKLMVYYEPRNYAVEALDNDRFRAHLTQDARVRKHGQKSVIWKKEAIVTYKPEADIPPSRLYIQNTIALKGLTPGAYDLEIVLHDEIAKDAIATRTLEFHVVKAPVIETTKGEPDEITIPTRSPRR